VRSGVWLAAAVAALCGILVGGYPLLISHSGLIVALAGVGVGTLAAGALASVAGIASATSVTLAGAVILIAEYLLALFISGSSFDYLSAAYAVMLLLLIELTDLVAAWHGTPPRREVLIERLRYLVTVLSGGAILAWLAAIGGATTDSSLVLLILGALGGLGAIALPLYLAREVLASDE
jgi:hypothetical protein